MLRNSCSDSIHPRCNLRVVDQSSMTPTNLLNESIGLLLPADTQLTLARPTSDLSFTTRTFATVLEYIIPALLQENNGKR